MIQRNPPATECVDNGFATETGGTEYERPVRHAGKQTLCYGRNEAAKFVVVQPEGLAEKECTLHDLWMRATSRNPIDRPLQASRASRTESDLFVISGDCGYRAPRTFRS